MGAYGLVCSATCNGKTFALKKITQPFANTTIAKRTFREFKLLSSFEHENVRFAMGANGRIIFCSLDLTDRHTRSLH